MTTQDLLADDVDEEADADGRNTSGGAVALIHVGAAAVPKLTDHSSACAELNPNHHAPGFAINVCHDNDADADARSSAEFKCTTI